MSAVEAWEVAGTGHSWICPDTRSSEFLRGIWSDQRLDYGESYRSDLHSTAAPLAAVGRLARPRHAGSHKGGRGRSPSLRGWWPEQGGWWNGEMHRGREANGCGLRGREFFSSSNLYLPSPRALKRIKFVM